MYPHGSLTGRLLAAAVALLGAAVAVVYAVHLIVSVWIPLVVIGGITAVSAVVYGVVRARHSRW